MKSIVLRGLALLLNATGWWTVYSSVPLFIGRKLSSKAYA